MGGDPTDQSYEDGDDCLDCWAAGHTPLHVKVTFSGIIVPPPIFEIPQVAFVLFQFLPCRWIVNVTYDMGPPVGNLEWVCAFAAKGAGPTSWVTLRSDIVPYFFSNGAGQPPPCTWSHANGAPPPGPNGGTAVVSWGPAVNENAFNAQPLT